MGPIQYVPILQSEKTIDSTNHRINNNDIIVIIKSVNKTSDKKRALGISVFRYFRKSSNQKNLEFPSNKATMSMMLESLETYMNHVFGFKPKHCWQAHMLASNLSQDVVIAWFINT